MAYKADNTDLNPEESLYQDYMQKGDDFMKIEIYRSAKEWYLRALSTNFNQKLIKEKLENCDKLIQREKKIIVIVVACIIIFSLVLVLA
jgi:hypothetical protein